jgi:hypothetical protein
MELGGTSVAASVQIATEKLSNSSDVQERGAIFTRPEVVDFILDLVGYTIDKPLNQFRLLEPSFGDGEFLFPIVDRLVSAYLKNGSITENPVEALKAAIKAVELHEDTFEATRVRLASLLRERGISQTNSEELLNSWLSRGDFLLEQVAENFSHIVGNPPYVRQELIDTALIAEYRRRFHTIYDRADIYVAFIEKSLFLLQPGGTLGFICSDRWMKNRYGGPLRRLIAERFHLKIYVDMVDTPAFQSDVIAYPAITVIQNERPGLTRVALQPQIERRALHNVAKALLDDSGSDPQIKEIKQVARGDDPWILESSDQLALVRRLESEFPTLEAAGCNVGIGVATGADRVFIGRYEDLDVEPDRKIPLAMTRDILTGNVEWRGYGVINPFSDGGGLVSLSEYPKLAAYLDKHGAEIRKRHVSKKNPRGWYRTIDRIYPALAKKPKLLIPDIKGEANIVYESGSLYPHHNLYFITSDVWELKALQVVLRSGIARLFVSIYSTKMRGGYLRFQAQYLRRIRIPHWQRIDPEIKIALITAAEDEDLSKGNAAVSEIYGLLKRREQQSDSMGNRTNTCP